MNPDNGILGRIPGQHISDALRGLPPAGTCTTDTAETIFDVPDIGRVRFTARRVNPSKRGSRPFWMACKAELLA